jgi:hypothetical protein
VALPHGSHDDDSREVEGSAPLVLNDPPTPTRRIAWFLLGNPN